MLRQKGRNKKLVVGKFIVVMMMMMMMSAFQVLGLNVLVPASYIPSLSWTSFVSFAHPVYTGKPFFGNLDSFTLRRCSSQYNVASHLKNKRIIRNLSYNDTTGEATGVSKWIQNRIHLYIRFYFWWEKNILRTVINNLQKRLAVFERMTYL